MFVATEAPVIYRAFQRICWFLFRLLTRLDVQGFENVPRSGPVIVSPNHLHMLDIPVSGMVVPRHTTILAADKWRGKLGGWIMECVTDVIYIARGEADREAMTRALAVLRSGGALAVAPEGTRSHTGGLQEGRDGAAYLASRSGAVIIPVAIWGHEHVFAALARLRRAPVHVRIGRPIGLPPGADRARAPQLHAITDEVMLELARLMPEEYRGVYRDRIEAGS